MLSIVRIFFLFGLWFMVFNATFNNISVISWWYFLRKNKILVYSIFVLVHLLVKYY